MNDSVLTRYLRACCRRLHQQQAALVNSFSLRTGQDIDLQPASGTMSLDLPRQGRAIATVTPIARYHPASQVWQWSWAAQGSLALQGHRAIALQNLASATGLKLFAMDQVELLLHQTLPVLAMACHQLRANGYYRWADGETFVFWAINHMALVTAPLGYSSNGDRIELASAQAAKSSPQVQASQIQASPTQTRPAQDSQVQISQLVRPSPSLLGEASQVPAWPMQRSLEGLFMHLLYPQSGSNCGVWSAELKRAADVLAVELPSC